MSAHGVESGTASRTRFHRTIRALAVPIIARLSFSFGETAHAGPA